MSWPLIRLKSPFAVLRGRRGAVLVFVAVALVPLLGITGLAMDGARAYIARANLSRALDAGALAAARVIRAGQDAAAAEAYAIAAANGVVQGANGTSLSLSFGTTEDGETTVAMSGTIPVPTLFMRVLGYDEVTVASVAEATVPPIDLVLVVDRSGSLADQGAWGPLQQAVRNFIRLFDEDIDQMGMTSFQVRAENTVLLQGAFQGVMTSAISSMNSAGDTNTGEGLRLAFEQFHLPAVRENAAQVVVFFTDGRPTAFRGEIEGQDRVIAVRPPESGLIRGYFNSPDNLPMDELVTPSGCAYVPQCFGWTEFPVRTEAKDRGVQMANEIRAAGITIYSIGLGNPAATEPILVPDMDYLRLLANVEGVSHPGQPKGQAYFAPSPSELEQVFRNVAEDLLVRLSR